jgi:hypothetical protein
MNVKWTLRLILVSALAGLVARSGYSGDPAHPSQGPAVRGLMEEKLMHAQKMLEAVVTSDWVALDTHTSAMEQLTQDPRWMVLKYPEYAQRSAAFVAALDDLKRAASRRDLAKAPEAYAALTLKCVDCHRYLARARMAQ